MFNTGVIVGFGSIGKRYAKHLSLCSRNLMIIDPRKIDGHELESIGPEARHFDSLKGLPTATSDNDVVVIANWGPDHLDTLESCIALGYRKFALEKPMVSRFSGLQRLEELIMSNNISVVVNQGWHYVRLAERINSLADSYSLGRPAAVWVTGGARCASTAGSHIIHFTNRLFSNSPAEVSAHGHSDLINPRSQDLAYIEGVFSVEYTSGQRLGISYTNDSSILGNVVILWRDAEALVIGEEEIQLSRRNPNRSFSNVITRYGATDEILFTGIPPYDSKEDSDYFGALFHALSSQTIEASRKDLKTHVESCKTLLYLLLSMRRRRTIEMTEEITAEEFDFEFNIS